MKLPICQGHTRRIIENLYELGEVLKMKRGQRLYRAGQKANYIYVVAKGEFEVEHRNEILMKH